MQSWLNSAEAGGGGGGKGGACVQSLETFGSGSSVDVSLTGLWRAGCGTASRANHGSAGKPSI